MFASDSLPSASSQEAQSSLSIINIRPLSLALKATTPPSTQVEWKATAAPASSSSGKAEEIFPFYKWISKTSFVSILRIPSALSTFYGREEGDLWVDKNCRRHYSMRRRRRRRRRRPPPVRPDSLSRIIVVVAAAVVVISAVGRPRARLLDRLGRNTEICSRRSR